jgi:hypothetical protein
MLPWAVAQRVRPMPRVVRLGRAANDNARLPAWRARIVTISLLLALSAWFVAERLFR